MTNKRTTLQDRIKELQPYFLGFEIKENLYIMRIVFPKKWSAYNNDDESIKVTKSDNGNEWFYYADINEVDLNDIFDLVEDTILTNESITKKIELMRQKMEELKELFQTESLDRLETLQFTFDDSVKKTNKRKYVRKKPLTYKVPVASEPIEIQEVTPITNETPKENLDEQSSVLYTSDDIDNITL